MVGREKSVLAVTRELIQGYAERGVFRSYGEIGRSAGQTEFRFVWLADEPFRLIYDPRRGRLTFRDLLPDVAARSAMDRDLRAFVKERTAAELPEHRRIDAQRAQITCYNRKGSISVALKLRLVDDCEYGVRKVINLVNDIFMIFLHRAPYYEYVAENFYVPGE